MIWLDDFFRDVPVFDDEAVLYVVSQPDLMRPLISCFLIHAELGTAFADPFIPTGVSGRWSSSGETCGCSEAPRT